MTTEQSGLESWLRTLRNVKAKVIDDILAGLTSEVIKKDLASTGLDIIPDAVDLWQTLGGTKLPEGSDPANTFERRLDSMYIFQSPKDACNQTLGIRSDIEQGHEAYEYFPQTCLPIAVSIGPDILALECRSDPKVRGGVYNYDPSSAELHKISASLNSYFNTMQSLFETNLLRLDENGELEVTNYNAYFKAAAKLNPGCDYWTS